MNPVGLPLRLRGGSRLLLSNTAATTPRTSPPSLLNESTKHFSTAPVGRESIAAPEIDFDGVKQKDSVWKQPGPDDAASKQFYARVVPLSRSYFGGHPIFLDTLITLRKLVRKYASLPVVQPGEAPRVAFRKLSEFRNTTGESVKSSKYSRIMEALRRLNHIHPSIRPKEVVDALNLYKRHINPHDNKPKPIPIDKFGRALGVGRRKSSTAQAFLVEGTGEVLVNGKSLVEFFGRVHDRESAVWALKATDRMDKYNVWAITSGGGTTGQAEALTLAVGKALIAHEPLLKPALRRAGCVTRDPRSVERKKPGHVKARKMPTWVKR